jgi:uncharacterized SAM-binding protein YcdF (DUF218 family)
LLLAPLERQYPWPSNLSQLPVHEVVVLGNGYLPADDIPVTAALNADGVVRIVEGVRVARILPGTRIVASGGPVGGQPASAIGYAKLARDLGVSDSSITVLDTPADTSAEAREVFKLLGNRSFLLVTSAWHMPRAMLLMRRAGCQPIAVPTGQLTRTGSVKDGWMLEPTSGGLRMSERALHEYLGLAAMKLGLE